MRYRRLSDFGVATPNPRLDYTFGRGAGEFLVNTPAAVGQSVLTRLNLWEGEWFLDKTEGTPWLQQILSANLKNTIPLYDQAIKRRVLQTPHVTSIADYSSNLNTTTRRLVVSIGQLFTEYGVTSIATAIGIPAATNFTPSLNFSDPRNSQFTPTI